MEPEEGSNAITRLPTAVKTQRRRKRSRTSVNKAAVWRILAECSPTGQLISTMPRKKPFSNKRKKKQLQAKRERGNYPGLSDTNALALAFSQLGTAALRPHTDVFRMD